MQLVAVSLALLILGAVAKDELEIKQEWIDYCNTGVNPDARKLDWVKAVTTPVYICVLHWLTAPLLQSNTTVQNVYNDAKVAKFFFDYAELEDWAGMTSLSLA